MKVKNKQIIENYFNALAIGDIPTVFSLFSENAIWHQPGKNKFSGDQIGLEAIGKMIGSMMEESEGSLKVIKSEEGMVNGNYVNVPVKFTVKKAGNQIDMKGFDLFRLENEKITEVWLFSENQEDEDQFWG